MPQIKKNAVQRCFVIVFKAEDTPPKHTEVAQVFAESEESAILQIPQKSEILSIKEVDLNAE